MVTQTIRVNLNQKDLETILAVQSDSLREIAFEFYATDAEEALQLDPDEFTVKFNMLKPDNNFVMTTFTDGIIKLSDNMTAVTGTGYYCILLMQDDELIYSGNGKIIINDHVIGTENIDSVSEADGYTFPDDFYTKDTPLAVLDDSTTSTTSTWSSSKISTGIASKASIDDNATNLTETWSSDKIATELAGKPDIDDTAQNTIDTWSSEKINSAIQSNTPIADNVISTTSTWSSNKINGEINTASTSAIAQLNAMKTGFDGVVYDSPAAMVQGEDQKLQNQIDGVNIFLDSKIEKDSTETTLTGTIETGLWNDHTGSIDSLSSYQNLTITSGFSVGDICVFSCVQASNVPVYASIVFYDANNVKIKRITNDTTGQHFTTEKSIPEGTAKIIVNGSVNYPPSVIKKTFNNNVTGATISRDLEELFLSKQDKEKSYTALSGTRTLQALWNANSKSASTGTVYNNYQYLVISSGFIPGKKYSFDCATASNVVFAGVVCYDSSMNELMRHRKESAGNETKVDLIIPSTTAYIYINGQATQAANMYEITYSNYDMGTIEEKQAWDEYALTNWMDRRYQDGEYEQFTRPSADHLIVTFSVDDSRQDVSDIANAFITAGYPICLATIPSRLANVCNDGTTVQAVCERVQTAGGEILTHNINTIGADTTAEEYFNYFVRAKKALTDAGFIVNGIIKSGGGTDDPDIKICKTYLRSYYDYGTGFQYIDDNRYNIGRADMNAKTLDELKAQVDSVASGGYLNYYMHEAEPEKAVALANYIMTKTGAEIVTVGDMFRENFKKSFKS